MSVSVRSMWSADLVASQTECRTLLLEACESPPHLHVVRIAAEMLTMSQSQCTDRREPAPCLRTAPGEGPPLGFSFGMRLD